MHHTKIEQIISVIDYIESHLSEKLDLEIISGAMHYSKYHLHRMFTAAVGLTLHDYIQRRRLTEAAKLLVFSEQPILDIALKSGYESQQAFSNIFTAMYKTSPGKYRDNEKFYPLQLKFDFGGNYPMLNSKEASNWNVTFAEENDIPCWMELVRLVIDGFPHLHADEYEAVLRQKIRAKQALILKDGNSAVGAMLFSYQTGAIDFMGVHPLYRKKGIPKAFLEKVMTELLNGKEISITTFLSLIHI